VELNYIDIELLERIVKYRETMGDVSETALVQLGFTRADIVNLYDQAWGFVRKPSKNEKPDQFKPKPKVNKQKRYISPEEKNKMFSQLCSVGVTPICALEIIDIVQDNTQNKQQRIQALEGLSKSIQDKVLKICVPYF
jgi:Holliday junction resolvasome RuvABC DNA-binding subunit